MLCLQRQNCGGKYGKGEVKKRYYERICPTAYDCREGSVLRKSGQGIKNRKVWIGRHLQFFPLWNILQFKYIL